MHIFIFLCILRSLLADIVVDTSSGPVRGVSSRAEDVEAFLGIPYAEPPIEELRFARPVPKTQWTSVYNASRLPPPCPQLGVGPYYFMPDITNMSEDCLYLNIWSPKTKFSRILRPVILFIHPGAFITGSSNLKAYDGSNLASRGDLVIATINYRLGALGFFLSYSEEAAGSMGMYDQVMAIKWVKDNVKLFGGDPENIVLMGVSAGAHSVSAHMLSPLTKNLFNKAIVQSGSIVHRMYIDDNAKLFENSQSLAYLVGCLNGNVTLKNDPHSVMKCLKNMSIEEIVAAEKKMLRTNPEVFFPRVNDEFLPKSSVDLLREGNFRKDVDVMMGITKEEGAILLTIVMQDYFGHYGGNPEFSVNKARALALSQGLLLSMKVPNSSKITRHYLSNVKNRTTTGYSKMISNILGDIVISCSTLFFADFLSLKGNSVYFYKFEFRAASTPMAEWIGTSHLDEGQYVFGNPYHENFTAEENELSHNLIDRLSAFARTGNPNIPGHMPWFRYSYHNPLYLNFGQEEESIRLKPNTRCELWRKQFNADFDTELIRNLQNSGINTTDSTFP